MKTLAKRVVSSFILLLSMVLLYAGDADAVPREWCYNRTRYYNKALKIPEKVCRPVWTGNRPRTDFNTLGGELARKPARMPSRSSTLQRDDAVTAEQMMGLFPGLFLNETTARELNTKMKKESLLPRPDGRRPEVRPSITGGPDGNLGFRGRLAEHDGDLHCPTFRNLRQAPASLTNTDNQSQQIVHFDSQGVYQYVHQGTCGSSSTQSCSGGGCFQEKSIVYLMVWTDNPDWPTGFEAFEVESYCSCKGITV